MSSPSAMDAVVPISPGQDEDDVSSEGQQSDYQERIAPHELDEETRELYLKELWKSFADCAAKGVVTLEAAKQIADDLRIDGEDLYLDQHVTDEEKLGGLTYQRVLRLFDDMGKTSTDEYDLEVEKGEGEGQIVYLGPLDYLIQLCSKKPEEEEGGERQNVVYKLKVSKEVTPKQLLLTSTGALMLCICAIIIVGMALMWSTTATSREEVSLVAFHRTVKMLFETIENSVISEHSKSMVEQAKVISQWVQLQGDEERQNIMHNGRLAAMRALTLLDEHAILDMEVVSEAMEAEILMQLGELGFVQGALFSGLSSFWSNPDVGTISRCGHETPAELRWPTFEPRTFPATFYCANWTAEKSHALETRGIEYTASVLNHVMDDTNGNVSTVFVATERGKVLTQTANCTNDDKEALCADIEREAVGLNATELTVRAYNNETHLLGVYEDPHTDLYVFHGIELKRLLRKQRQRVVDIINHLNFNFERSTELVVSTRNETTGGIIRQATEYRFSDLCHGECQRFDASSANIIAGFEKHDAGWTITPDYRPEPVSGAYAYIGSDIDIIIMLERDVLEMRGIAFNTVVNIIDNVNRDNPGTVELEMVGFEEMPKTKQYYAYDPCPPGTDCIIDSRGYENVNGSQGVIFRYSCRHCQRVTEFLYDKLVLFQQRKKTKEDAPTPAPTSYLPRLLGAQEGLERDNDYLDNNILVAFGPMENFTMLLTAKVDIGEIMNPINNAIGISVGVGIGFLVVGMALLVGLSHKAFDAIEAEWSAYKKQIEREQEKFADLVRGIIPPSVAERLMRGSKIIFDSIPVASFVFTDICGLNDLTKNWTPKHVARYVTYCLAVLDEIAAACAMTKLRTIGGLHICVGSRDEKKGTQNQAAHPACRAIRFASLAMIIFSKRYSHYPQNIRVFKDVFKDVNKEVALEMPLLRIGIHCGPAVSGAFTIGKTSHYDFFGISPSLANRMQQTAQPGRVHCTMMVKEMLKTRDPELKYSFEASRKTVVRGQGTITSYFVRSIVEPVPPEVLDKLSIRLSISRFDFGTASLAGTDSDRSSAASSVKSGSSARSRLSQRSANSKKERKK